MFTGRRREGEEMDRNSWIYLIVGIILIGLFMVSWLVFKNIKTTDWVCLALGILDLIMLVFNLNKNKH